MAGKSGRPNGGRDAVQGSRPCKTRGAGATQETHSAGASAVHGCWLGARPRPCGRGAAPNCQRPHERPQSGTRGLGTSAARTAHHRVATALVWPSWMITSATLTKLTSTIGSQLGRSGFSVKPANRFGFWRTVARSRTALHRPVKSKTLGYAWVDCGALDQEHQRTFTVRRLLPWVHLYHCILGAQGFRSRANCASIPCGPVTIDEYQGKWRLIFARGAEWVDELVLCVAQGPLPRLSSRWWLS